MLVNQLFDSMYFRIAIASLLSILLAFSSDVKMLDSSMVLIILLIVLILMILTNFHRDYGLIILLSALFVISYNNHQRRTISHK